jgi:hypothetical protein
MMNRFSVVVAGVVMLGAALAGCSGTPATVSQGGPLAGEIDPHSHSTDCFDMKPKDILVDGFNSIPNSGQQDATVTKVAFVDPQGLRQIAAYVIPTTALFTGIKSATRRRAPWTVSTGHTGRTR